MLLLLATLATSCRLWYLVPQLISLRRCIICFVVVCGVAGDDGFGGVFPTMSHVSGCFSLLSSALILDVGTKVTSFLPLSLSPSSSVLALSFFLAPSLSLLSLLLLTIAPSSSLSLATSLFLLSLLLLASVSLAALAG